MSDMSIREKICHYIAARLPENVLREIHEGIVLKFSSIESSLQEQIDPRFLERVRPQLQRYAADTVLASQEQNTTVSVQQTDPKGELFVEIKEPGLTLSHIELKQGDLPRAAKYREKMARPNSNLEPDMFRSAEEIEAFDSLHVALVVVVPYAKESLQGVPKKIYISVPYSDFRSFHVRIEIDEFYEFYERRKEINPTMIDAAWPALKQDILKVESQDKASSSE